MRLHKVHFRNFRSIENQTLVFDYNFKILIGKNESGKSNILKGLQYLDSNRKIEPHDKREALVDESAVERSQVIFEFLPSDDEVVEVIQSAISNMHQYDDTTPIVQVPDGSKLSLSEFIKKYFKTFLTWVDFGTGIRDFGNWYFGDVQTFTLLLPFKRLKNIPRPNKQNVSGLIKDFYIINEDIEVLDSEYISLTVAELSAFIRQFFFAILNKHNFKALLWNYEEKNILPASINLNDFVANTEVCLPLKKIFELAEINNVKDSINTAKKSSENTFRNLLSRVANKATAHFRDVWPEYTDVEFSLLPNGDFLNIGIKESNIYSMEQRSDGFKRFVSFLLLISTEYKIGKLENHILLFDEPEISLHPSGIKYLRDELIKISDKNYIVSSTHSIFMVDAKNIERHYIVKKEKEKTTIEVAKEDKVVEEEVINKALGFSAFEFLNEKNIVFEGYYDKILFRKACEKLTGLPKNVKKVLISAGTCHANGLPHIKSITPILDLAKRKCYILSDNDGAAKAQKLKYLELNGFGDWYLYGDILEGTLRETAEDFLKKDIIFRGVDFVKSEYSQLQTVPVLNVGIGIVGDLKKWILSNGYDEASVKEIQRKYKEFVFKELKYSDIDTTYFEYLKRLGNILNA